jgi:xylose dehydrogenase (NAD/NADP)
MSDQSVRWGILGTAGISVRSFLPAIARVEGVEVSAVGSRDVDRARAFAVRHGIGRAYGSYAALVEDPDLHAVYVPLPNHLHREWVIRALAAGKAVLCEKPLGLDPEEVTAMVEASEHYGQPLWEAFVFPFQEQFHVVQAALPRIGRVTAVHGSFTFRLTRPDDFRWTPEWGGGALYDVGCYPAHLAQLLLDREPVEARGFARRAPTGVDLTTEAVVRFQGDAWLVLNASFADRLDTFCRILGEAGEIRLQHPYHQGSVEVVEVHGETGVESIRLATDLPSFQPMLVHIRDAVRKATTPRHLARWDSLRTARILELIRQRT